MNDTRRNLQWILFALFTTLTVLSSFATYGQENLVNKFVKPIGDINLRNGLPEGMFLRNSQVVGTVGKDDVLLVEDVKESKQLFQSSKWLKVRIVNPTTPKMEAGWVYYGTLENPTGQATPYFQVIDKPDSKKEGEKK